MGRWRARSWANGLAAQSALARKLASATLADLAAIDAGDHQRESPAHGENARARSAEPTKVRSDVVGAPWPIRRCRVSATTGRGAWIGCGELGGRRLRTHSPRAAVETLAFSQTSEGRLT